MTNNDHSSYIHYRDAVCAQLNRYLFALDSADDRIIASIARAELPRYVRYWVTLLAKHEATATGKCPACSRWWRTVSAPCNTWKWVHAFLAIAPARTTVPTGSINKRFVATQHQTWPIVT